jgi:hypothetical protein
LGLSKRFTKALLDLPPEYGLDCNAVTSCKYKDSPLRYAIQIAQPATPLDQFVQFIDFDAIKRILDRTNNQVLNESVVQIIKSDRYARHRKLGEFEQVCKQNVDVLEWFLDSAHLDGSRLGLHLPMFEFLHDPRFVVARQSILDYRSDFASVLWSCNLGLIDDLMLIVQDFILG